MKLSSSLGRLALLALLPPALLSCAGDAPKNPVTPDAGPRLERETGVRLLIVSGNSQTGEPGMPLPEPLVVKVLDQDDQPVADAVVNWLVMGAAGAVDPRQGRTDATGHARATWTLGPDEGEQTLRASGVGGTVLFTANAAPRPAGGLFLVVSPDSLVLGAGENGQFTASLTDGMGAPVTGTVTWTSRSPGVATVDAAGRVTAVAPGLAWIVARSGDAADSGYVRVRQPAERYLLDRIRMSSGPTGGPLDVTYQTRTAGFDANFWEDVYGFSMRVKSPSGRLVNCGNVDRWSTYIYKRWMCSVMFDPSSERGIWTVDEVRALYQGRWITFTHADLVAADVRLREFEVVNHNHDRTPPRFTRASAALEGNRFRLRATAGDEETGIYSMNFVMTSPSGRQQAQCWIAPPTPGNVPQTGTFEWTCAPPVPSSAESGTWSIARVTAADRRGNAATLRAEDMRRMGPNFQPDVQVGAAAPPPPASTAPAKPVRSPAAVGGKLSKPRRY